MSRLSFLRLFVAWRESISLLGALAAVMFVWCMCTAPILAHQAAYGGVTLILLLATSFTIMAQKDVFSVDAERGILLFLRGNGDSLHFYTGAKLFAAWARLVLPTSVCIALYALFYTYTQHAIVFAIQCHISLTIALLFAHVIAALSLSVSAFFSLFLIYPFLVPTLLLTLASWQEPGAQKFVLLSLTDTVILNFSFFAMTLGTGVLMIPKLLNTFVEQN